MKKILYINSCIRKEESRTKVLADSFFSNLEKSFKIEEVVLSELDIRCLTGDFYLEREELISKNNFHHPRFDLAHKFATSDIIVIAAPFWDLSIPAILKVFIENICVESITFGYDEKGLVGLCKATDLVYITTRGGAFENSPLEHGANYINSMSKFWGIENFHCISADNLDLDPSPAAVNNIINAAKTKVKEVANKISNS